MVPSLWVVFMAIKTYTQEGDCSPLPGLLSGTPTGAGIGAASGYGYSEGDPFAALMFGTPEEWEEEAKQAATGAAVGGGIGATTGAAFPLIGAGLRAIGRTVTTSSSRRTSSIVPSCVCAHSWQ